MLKIMYGKPLIMIATVGAVTLFLGGWRLLKYTWLPVAYLFFAIPLPQQLYFQITNPMRQLAALVSTMVLNMVPQLEATVQGSTIDVLYRGVRLEPGLDVADACSGMRLLMAFVALGVAMAYLHWRPIWQRLILLASTVPIAILCNIVRVTITGLIYVLWDPQYAQGIYHDMLGMLMLPLAFGLYGGLAWLMSNLFVDEEDDQPKEDIIVRKSSASVTGEV
jgi:exosortase